MQLILLRLSIKLIDAFFLLNLSGPIRSCPIDLINVLNYWYKNSVTTVRWDKSFSNYVNVSAGIRPEGAARCTIK